MTGLKRLSMPRRIRPTVVVLALLAATAGCQSEGWRFARRELPVAAPHYAAAPASHDDHASSGPIVRGQYSADAGVSTPALGPRTSSSWSGYSTPESYPTTSVSSTSQPTVTTYPNYPTYPAADGTTTPTTNGTTPTSSVLADGSQPATPSPAYGSDFNEYPRFVPPVSGDASGMGPYEIDRGPDPTLYPPFTGDPTRDIPLRIRAEEAMTGRFILGVGVNSDAGVVGSIIVDEQNFDWRRWPTSFEDIRAGRAWRGDGQRFRLEAAPGTQVHRYLVSFEEPYWMDSQVSLGLSGQYYTRYYESWSEERLGGRVALGYHFNHALTGSVAFRGQRVVLYNLPTLSPPELLEAKGASGLYGFSAQLAHDTRDNRFLATEGHLIELGFEQVIGTFQYPQVNLDIRKYFLLHERPDGSGRHVLSLSSRVGWTGSDTPIYEHFFAGGFSTIRGFDFRNASPYDPTTRVYVGGEFMMLASAEYLFPITADDMLRGVVFCDTGTVEPTIGDWTDRYRVAPGFGLRITVPAMGPAPIALDFAFPVSKEDTDQTRVFSFWMGWLR
ncbi:MAG: BamA/TamA family outer membrane protein [Pirellulaceae bacterium]|nr:BamA/TamA family outer membrane protein [Pirellulaceae bacterium]